MSSKSFLGAGALSPCCHTDAYSTGTILLFCSEIPSKYLFSGSVAHNSQYGAPDLRSAFTNSLKGRALPSIKERNGVLSFVARRRKLSKKKAFKLHASNEALRQEDSVTCKLENISDSSDGIVAGSSDVLISLSEKIATECLYDTLSVGEFNNSHSGSIPRQLTIFEDPFLTHGWSPEDKPKSSLESEAWELLRASIVNYCGNPVGTIAANDPGDTDPVNYDQVFIRDFIPSAMAFLLNGESEIVRNFILHTLQLQSWEKSVDCHSPGQGLMPASFKIRTLPLEGDSTEDVLDADFGEAAIGRVAPVDSGLWWIILLRAYGKCTGDLSLQERVDVQTGIKLILKLCLSDGFDMFPTLLVTDGSCMIDRRMGIHGHPLEIQALFYSALQCAKELLTLGDGAEGLMKAVNSRLYALSFHIREYYWVDLSRLNEIYRYKTEEYSHDAVNKFNIYPDQIPSWLVDWMPQHGGYFIGNLQPAHMDFRFFSLGNLWSIVTSLTTQKQAEAILDLIESRWDDLIASMPLKICYPALEREEWRIITGSDPKNTPWSYHNGGSWPTLIWQFTAACIKMGRSDLAARAVSILESRISKDRWPEYYDTRKARFIGKQAKLYQTWSIAGYLVAKQLLRNPEAINIFTCEDNSNLLEGLFCNLEESPRRNRRKGATIQV